MSWKPLALRHDAPEMIPRSSFLSLLLQQLDWDTDLCRKIIMAFFFLWLLLLFPEPSIAFLGGAVVILFWDSGCYGPMSAWFLSSGLQISPLEWSCLSAVQNAFTKLWVWFQAHLSTDPLPASLIDTNHQLPSPVLGLNCGTRFILSQHMLTQEGEKPLQLSKSHFTYAHKASFNSTQEMGSLKPLFIQGTRDQNKRT